MVVFYGAKEGHDKMKTKIDSESLSSWLQITACRAKSRVEAGPLKLYVKSSRKALDSDWYVFQDAGAFDQVAMAVQSF